MTVAWCIRFSLGNRNPKGIVLLWRVQFVALLLISAGMVFPPLWNIRTQRFHPVVRQAGVPELRIEESARIPRDPNSNPYDLRPAITSDERDSTVSDLAILDKLSLEQVPVLSEGAFGAIPANDLSANETANLSNASSDFPTPIPANGSVVHNRARTLSDVVMYPTKLYRSFSPQPLHPKA